MPTVFLHSIKGFGKYREGKEAFFESLLFNCFSDLKQAFREYFASFGIITFLIPKGLRFPFCVRPLPNAVCTQISTCRAF